MPAQCDHFCTLTAHAHNPLLSTAESMRLQDYSDQHCQTQLTQSSRSPLTGDSEEHFVCHSPEQNQTSQHPTRKEQITQGQRHQERSGQKHVLPPSTRSKVPVQKEASSDARKAIAAATSSGLPIRFMTALEKVVSARSIPSC